MNLKKLLMLVAGTVLVVPTTLSVVACNDASQLKKIDSVITTKNLQEIIVPSSDSKPSVVEILTSINKVDKSNLTVKDVDITNITITSADVAGIGNYDGVVTVTFTTKVEKNIDAVIKTKDLGIITVSSSSKQPTDKDVLDAINNVNKGLNLTDKDVKITVKDDKSATVAGINDYDSSTTVTFTTKVEKNIDVVIKTKALGIITVSSSSKQPTDKDVLDAINNVNKGLNLTDKDVKITVKDDKSAAVAGINDYDSSTTVTFTTVKQYLDSEIQDAIKKDISENNPLKLSIKKTENYDTAVQELTNIFKKDDDKIFVDLLSKDMQKQFDINKLGFYDQVYDKPVNGNYVSKDFFKNVKSDVKVYFYIAYNKDHHTDDGTGIFMPVILTITK